MAGVAIIAFSVFGKLEWTNSVASVLRRKSNSSKPTKLRAICELLWGPRCISDLARAMGVTVRIAQLWATQGDDRVPDYVWTNLRPLLIERRALIDKMPNAVLSAAQASVWTR